MYESAGLGELFFSVFLQMYESAGLGIIYKNLFNEVLRGYLFLIHHCAISAASVTVVTTVAVGKVKKIVVPFPSSDSTQILPP
jgi:hypothetical protein